METRSEKKANIILFVLATLFSIGLLEVGLRFFTPFPTGGSNKFPHPALGYVLNSRVPGIDSFGFRNVSRNRRGGEIAAVGDSHTFGIGVSPSESWPSVLSTKTGRTVYNYGIPGYEPYRYHFLVKQAIDDGAQYIIIALLLHFDSGSDLAIPCAQLTTDYYKEFDKLVDNDYEALCSKGIKAESNNILSGIVNNRGHDFQLLMRHAKKLAKKILKEKIAITSAVDELVFSRYRTDRRFEISGEKITYSIKINQKVLDRVGSRVASLKKTLLSIKEMCSTHSVSCGFLLLPSVGRTISLVRSDIFDRINESPRKLDREISLVDEIKEFHVGNDMEFSDAAPYVALAFHERLSIGGALEVMVPYDSHPRRAGYAAYADAAADLLTKLQVNSKSIKPESRQ